MIYMLIDSFGGFIYMQSDAIIRIVDLSGEIVSENKHLRKMMVNRSLVDCRIFVFLFLLFTILPPFSKLTRFKWFRHNYHRVRTLFRKLALFFDFMH